MYFPLDLEIFIKAVQPSPSLSVVILELWLKNKIGKEEET